MTFKSKIGTPIVNTRLLFRPLFIGGLLFLLAVGSAVYFFNQYKKAQTELAMLKAQPPNEAQQLYETVAKLAVLPDETPTIATVTDIEQVKDRPFFTEAKNGDKVLIFNNARRAVLYDPVANKIVNIAPLTIGDEEQLVSPTPALPIITPTPVEELRFLLRNGTDRVGLTRLYEEELIKQVTNAVVVDRENAANKDYQESILIVVNNDKQTQAEEVSQTLDIKVSSLPKDEEKPQGVDFVIILGADKKSF